MKILIIEDEIELAKSMVQYLSEEKYLCEVANTFAEATDKIEQFSYDCILLDISLPDGNGLRLLEELKSQGKQDGVIIISTKNSLDDKIKGLQIANSIDIKLIDCTSINSRNSKFILTHLRYCKLIKKDH